MNEPDHDHEECKALFARLSEYLDNELDSATRQSIKAHLDQCKPCQVCLATLKRTVSLCRAVKDAPIPDSLSRRLRKLISSNR
jgi:anti-sigma factor RsiW